MADEHWLAGLHGELEDEATSAVDATTQSGWDMSTRGAARAQTGPPVGGDSQGDDLAMLAVELRRIKDRLAAAKEAMAEARSVCAASSVVIERILSSRPDQQLGAAPPERPA